MFTYATNKSTDLAANAETQGLKQYANHKDIRLIYIITEVSYRLVARVDAGIKSLSDCKVHYFLSVTSIICYTIHSRPQEHAQWHTLAAT